MSYCSRLQGLDQEVQTTTSLLHRHEQRGRECAANNDGVLVGAEGFDPIHTCQDEEDCRKAIGTEVGCSRHLVPAIKSGGNAGGFDMPFSLCPGWQLADEGGRGWGRISQPSRAVEDSRNLVILFLGATCDLFDQGDPKPGVEAEPHVREAGLGRHAE